MRKFLNILLPLLLFHEQHASETSFPEPTVSTNCPAINFSHGVELNEFGLAIVKFRPSLLSAKNVFGFVDVHYAVVDENGGRLTQLFNRKMKKRGVFYVHELDSETVVALQQGQLKYSFSYRAKKPGEENSTACDTSAVITPLKVKVTQLSWVQLPIQCPTQCGLPSSVVYPELQCIDSYGNEHPDQACANIPVVDVQPVVCPPTQACMTYDWIATYPKCPTRCGLLEVTLRPTLVCMDSDGMKNAERFCEGLPRPSPRICKTTTPCQKKSNIAGVPTISGRNSMTESFQYPPQYAQIFIPTVFDVYPFQDYSVHGTKRLI